MKQQSILFCAALVAGLSFGMPARAEPPPWAPAHGYRAKQAREYRYVYYPAQQVYYAPQTNSWFWLNGGVWQVGVVLPSRYRISASNGGVSVMLHSAQPYVEHVYVEQHYGRPWREQHRQHHRHDEHRRHHGYERHHEHDRHHEHGEHGHGHGG